MIVYFEQNSYLSLQNRNFLVTLDSLFMKFLPYISFYGSPKVPSVCCKIFLIWCRNFNVSCKISLMWQKNRFGVKILLFDVKVLALRLIVSEYFVTFLIKNLVQNIS